MSKNLTNEERQKKIEELKQQKAAREAEKKRLLDQAKDKSNMN
jgi:hypothetical protein